MKKNLLFVFAVIAISIQAKNNKVNNCIIVNNVEYQSLPPSVLLDEPFNNLTNNGWTAYSIAGTQAWGITAFGNPAPAVYMNGFGGVNEDWLISKSIDLTSGYTAASFSFQTDGRYTGNSLEVYITTDIYINGAAPNTVTWTKLNAIFDSDFASFGGFVPSGNIDLTTYLGKNVRIAFKYTNTSSAIASAWEVDNFKVIASENLSVANVTSEEMKLYPNPVKEVLNFSEEVSNVKITDISGKIMKEIFVNGKSLDISKLEKGVYVVITTVKSGKTIINKIVKE